MEQIEDAVAKGATLRTGGRRVDRPGAFVEATVLTDVTPGHARVPRGTVRTGRGGLPGG